MELGILIIIVACIFLGKLLIDRSKKMANLDNTYDKVSEIQNYIETVKKSGKIPTIKTSLILKNDEEAYLEDAVKLYEIRSARKSDRLFVGGRIMKGIFVGGSTGVSRSFDEMREIDHGKLVLTNKRIVFDGQFNSRIIDLEKIISINLYDDGFEIACEDKKQSQLYGGIRNPFLWKNLTTGIIKTRGLENKVLTEEDLKDIRQAEGELNQLSEDLKKRLNKS